jgi:hypothetical protein
MAGKTGFMTEEERECIGLSIDSELLAGKLHNAELDMKKLHAWIEFPDAIIAFGDILILSFEVALDVEAAFLSRQEFLGLTFLLVV